MHAAVNGLILVYHYRGNYRNIFTATAVLPPFSYRYRGITVEISPFTVGLLQLLRYYRFPHYRVTLYPVYSTVTITHKYTIINDSVYMG